MICESRRKATACPQPQPRPQGHQQCTLTFMYQQLWKLKECHPRPPRGPGRPDITISTETRLAQPEWVVPVCRPAHQSRQQSYHFPAPPVGRAFGPLPLVHSHNTHVQRTLSPPRCTVGKSRHRKTQAGLDPEMESIYLPLQWAEQAPGVGGAPCWNPGTWRTPEASAQGRREEALPTPELQGLPQKGL